ncbi:poly(U)-specific 3'-to-5' RNA exonuclease [Friedmanniomyces endolithicus]|nr:poly(U)-specific 3'-to-5' RNA exonuclease [Friedmanniomyces endolithicus]
MPLVEYSDSESEVEVQIQPPSKKRKLITERVKELPPLPSSFRDQYSSTVRSSTRDDPSLHGGRKRATPHVDGNWPTHVYLEWIPQPAGTALLSELIAEERSVDCGKQELKSLLHNELGVCLPLHVSLSRPLVLQKTAHKEPFVRQLGQAIARCNARAFRAVPTSLRWHPNELGTCWFLVLQLPENRELAQLLSSCNDVAALFDQPLLYTEGVDASHAQDDKKKTNRGFHISIAWSLNEPESAGDDPPGKPWAEQPRTSRADSDRRLAGLSIAFSEIKVRVGQDVSSIPLAASQAKKVNSDKACELTLPTTQV